MTKFSNRLLAPGFLAVFVLMFASPVVAVQIYGGWTRADVGLQNKGDGFFVGVGNEIPMSSGFLDASYALEYVQKVGSQPTFFSDPETGFTITDAEVTLHCVQPSIFLGARVPDIGIVPRVYVGTSFVLKVSEEWSEFPGQPHIEWGYKSTDIVGHIGVSLGMGPVTVDFRYTQGFLDQLLLDNTLVNAAKAEIPPEGTPPEIGAKLTNIQLGAGFTF
jgi:hypothetical protein